MIDAASIWGKRPYEGNSVNYRNKAFNRLFSLSMQKDSQHMLIYTQCSQWEWNLSWTLVFSSLQLVQISVFMQTSRVSHMVRQRYSATGSTECKKFLQLLVERLLYHLDQENERQCIQEKVFYYLVDCCSRYSRS